MTRDGARRREARKERPVRSYPSLRLPILASVAATVVLRILYLATADNPFWRTLGLDLEVYDLWARRILQAPPFGGDVLLQAPFFPLALSVAYATLGEDPVRALYMHLIPAVLATASVAWVAGRWKGRAAAWTAGVLATLHEPSIFYTGVLLPPSWVLGLTGLVLLLGYRLADGPARAVSRESEARPLTGAPGRIALGAALGLLVWAQPVTLVLLVVLVAFAGESVTGKSGRRPFWREPGPVMRAHWRGTAWLCLGVALPLSVTFLYNASRGAPALVALNGGINLYIGNGPEATGAYVRPAGMEENRDLLGIRLAERIQASEGAGENREARDGGSGPKGGSAPGSGGEPSGGGGSTGDLASQARSADRFWWNRALSSMAADPARAARLYARKLGFLFTDYEIPQVESLPYESRFSPILRLPLPGMAILLAGGALGAALLWRDRVARWLLASILVLALGLALFFVTARFRMPLVPWMMVLAAGGVAELVRDVRGDRSRLARPRVVAALGIAVLVGLGSAFLPTGIAARTSQGQYAFRQGVIAEQAGRTEEAIAFYREALAIDPTLAKATVNLGTMLARQGRLEEAGPLLARAVELDPGSAIAHQNLGQLHEVEGRFDAALEEFQRAIAADPELVSARESAAYLLHRLGRVEESRKQLQAVFTRVPKGSPPELRSGTLFALVSERREQATASVRAGAREDWWNVSELLRADVLLAQRQIPEAARIYRDLRADPTVAPYAEAILVQLEESGVVPRQDGQE